MAFILMTCWTQVTSMGKYLEEKPKTHMVPDSRLPWFLLTSFFTLCECEFSFLHPYFHDSVSIFSREITKANIIPPCPNSFYKDLVSQFILFSVF